MLTILTSAFVFKFTLGAVIIESAVVFASLQYSEA